MKVLVTTPNGKVGSEVVRLLLERGVQVRIGAHTVEKAQAAFPGTEVVHFSYDDEASVQAALVGVDTLYFAAPGNLPAAPQIRVIELAKVAGVKRIVRLSAKGVENTDTDLRQVEKAVEASGLEWTILRPTWFMQNYSTMSAQGVAQGVITEPAGDAKTSYIDARDIAAVATAALTEPGHVGKHYTLTGPTAHTRSELAEVFAKHIGRPVQYVALSDEQFRANLQDFMPADYVNLLSALYGAVRAGYTADVSSDVEQVLGRSPISFEQFVQDHVTVWAQPQPAS